MKARLLVDINEKLKKGHVIVTTPEGNVALAPIQGLIRRGLAEEVTDDPTEPTEPTEPKKVPPKAKSKS